MPSFPLLQSQAATNNSYAFCRHILPRVSRTFAINIACLNGDLHKAVLAGYLFCRLLDTIEDSPVLSPLEKASSLNLWAENFPFRGIPEILAKSLSFSQAIKGLSRNPYETLLIQSAARVFELFGQIPLPFQECMAGPIQTMARGMALFQQMAEKNGGQGWIEDLPQLEEYCYYVAGTVGEMLTRLFLANCPELSEGQRKKLQERAVAFGLGLQLTNIIKDIQDDWRRNWCYLPSSLLQQRDLTPQRLMQQEIGENVQECVRVLIQRAEHHLDAALEYCVALPRWNRPLRLFCLLPLHFAIQTLALARCKNISDGSGKIKIPRRTVQVTILFSSLTYPFQGLQKWFYTRHRSQIPKI